VVVRLAFFLGRRTLGSQIFREIHESLPDFPPEDPMSKPRWFATLSSDGHFGDGHRRTADAFHGSECLAVLP
jgi:hypothetical protein